MNACTTDKRVQVTSSGTGLPANGGGYGNDKEKAMNVKEIKARHMDFWEWNETSEPIVSSQRSKIAAIMDVRGCAKKWKGKDSFFLSPDMDSPVDFELDFQPHVESPLVCGPVFNTAWPFFYHRIPWIAAVSGCPIKVCPEAKSIWATEFLDEHWHTKENLTVSLDGKWLNKLLEFTRYLVENANGRYFVCQDEIARGPGDLLANMMGTENFLTGMYDYPKKIKQLLADLTDIWIEVARAQFEIIPKFHDGYCNQYGLWSPGITVKMQEDSACNLSPDMYREFLLPFDTRIIEAMDYQYFHTHSGYSHIAECIAVDIKALKAINVDIDFCGPSLEELVPIWRGIQEKKRLIISGAITNEQLDFIKSHLSPTGLMLDIVLTTEERRKAPDFYAVK